MPRSLVLAALVACGGPSPPAPLGNATRQPPVVDDVRCLPDGNVVATGGVSADAPSVALYDRYTTLDREPLPTLVLWPDGNLMYGDDAGDDGKPLLETFRLVAARVEPQTADRIHETVSTLLRGAQVRNASAATDMETTTIVVRDGAAWRAIMIDDLIWSTPQSSVPAPLLPIYGAYRALLHARPSSHVPVATRMVDGAPAFRGRELLDDVLRCARQRPEAPPNR
jgi:hypothetical protein